MKRTLVLVLAFVLALSCFTAAMAEEPLYISVISKGEQHAFWQAVRKGCEDAANEYNVEMYYYGPPSESDVVLQVEALNAEMQKEPQAIALAALSTESVMAQLQECIQKGIPVIGFDSGVPNAPEGSIRATASTNNQKAAALAAEKMLELEGFADALTSGTPEAPVVIGVLSQDATGESVTSRNGMTTFLATGDAALNGYLRGALAEIEMQEALDAAAEAGADKIFVTYLTGTVVPAPHSSWMAATANAALRDWMFAQVNDVPYAAD